MTCPVTDNNIRWIFNYKKATAEQWMKFSEATSKFSTDNHLDIFNIESGYDAINKLWGSIQQGITSAAKKYLPNSQYKKSIRNPKPDYLVEAYSHLRVSSRSVMKFSSKYMHNHTLPSPTS